MNRKYLIIAVAVLALGCIGTLQAFTHLETQEPQEIRGIVVDEYDAAWYEQQQTLWLKKAQANPTDEHAWEQCFSAARYADMLNDQYGMTDRKKAVLDEMAKHIPNSFTYNLAMYQTERDMQGAEASLWAEKALQQQILLRPTTRRRSCKKEPCHYGHGSILLSDEHPNRANGNTFHATNTA